LHFGHAEPGETIDFDSGIRQIQTFKKLPMHAPIINAIIKIGSVGIDVYLWNLTIQWPIAGQQSCMTVTYVFYIIFNAFFKINA